MSKKQQKPERETRKHRTALCTVRGGAGRLGLETPGRIPTLYPLRDMADSASSAPAPATTTPKKAKAAAAASKKPRTKPSHPPTSDMVNAAIKSLKERGGSSLQAIKKYISANYKVDAEKLAPFIRKYLKSAVASGALTQPKGKGASGSFKLSVKSEGKPAATGAKKTAAAAKKPAKPKGEKKAKPAAAKKAAVKKPAAAAAKKAKKSPSKAKKVAKPPTKKPKSPKPKKAAVKKPKTPKKTAAKKK